MLYTPLDLLTALTSIINPNFIPQSSQRVVVVVVVVVVIEVVFNNVNAYLQAHHPPFL